MIYYKSSREIELMKRPNRVVGEVLSSFRERVKPGVATSELDSYAEDIILKRGARPAFKGYRGFPATLCTSLNNQIVHGIPSKDVILEEGDIISIDVGAEIEGWFGDAAFTFPVGKISDEDARLLSVTSKALEKGIDVMRPDNRISDIGHAVQTYAESHGFSVVRDYVGHGIGRQMHESPQVPNYGEPGHGPKMKVGVVLAVEPMINAGTWEAQVKEDGWTVVTADGSKSAHFEHTIAVTENGPEVLSKI